MTWVTLLTKVYAAWRGTWNDFLVFLNVRPERLFGEFGERFSIDNKGCVWRAMRGADDIEPQGLEYRSAALLWTCADDETVSRFEVCGGVKYCVYVWSFHAARVVRIKGTMLEAIGKASRGLLISLANWRMQWV